MGNRGSIRRFIALKNSSNQSAQVGFIAPQELVLLYRAKIPALHVYSGSQTDPVQSVKLPLVGIFISVLASELAVSHSFDGGFQWLHLIQIQALMRVYMYNLQACACMWVDAYVHMC